jgi:AcrR family transcriptional regulator
MNRTAKTESAKDRILDAASTLFYENGYNATGVQQIIDAAGVSKGAFYNHFKTKDDLGLAYLRKRHNDEITHLKQGLGAISEPYERYSKFNIMMGDWMKESDFRGCAFSNMSAEIPDGNNPIRKEAKYHYESFRMLIKDMVEDLVKSDPKYHELDIDRVANDFMMITIGALTNAEIYQDVWPHEHAQKQIMALIP